METGRTPLTDFVIDASVAIVWFLPDETNPIADKALIQLDAVKAYVPDLFWHEMRNVLMICFRRKRLTSAEVWHSMHRLEQLDIVTAMSASGDQILTLANRHNLTAYDAAYLAVAMDMRLPLATLDKQLSTAAAREGLPLLA